MILFKARSMLDSKKNILILMADQMTPFALAAYGHSLTRTPNLDRLAKQGVVFDSAYCASPLCAPSRFSFLSGKLPSAIGAYDNAAEFPSQTLTFAHYLRAEGYRTILSGKMHFCGADQLHGFEERLTTDIYPADFGWTPNWDDFEASTPGRACARTSSISTMKSRSRRAGSSSTLPVSGTREKTRGLSAWSPR
jgi:choline-sulfatase